MKHRTAWRAAAVAGLAATWLGRHAAAAELPARAFQFTYQAEVTGLPAGQVVRV